MKLVSCLSSQLDAAIDILHLLLLHHREAEMLNLSQQRELMPPWCFVLLVVRRLDALKMHQLFDVSSQVPNAW